MTDLVKMKAPVGVGGQIHASASGRNYDILDGAVSVERRDVGDLIRAGFMPASEDEIKAALGPSPASTFSQDTTDPVAAIHAAAQQLNDAVAAAQSPT